MIQLRTDFQYTGNQSNKKFFENIPQTGEEVLFIKLDHFDSISFAILFESKDIPKLT